MDKDCKVTKPQSSAKASEVQPATICILSFKWKDTTPCLTVTRILDRTV